MTLMFGCSHPDEDHLYQEEMLEMARKGVLHEVHTACPHPPGQPKVKAAAAGVVGEPSKLRLWGMPGSPHAPHTSKPSSPQL